MPIIDLYRGFFVITMRVITILPLGGAECNGIDPCEIFCAICTIPMAVRK